MDRRQCKFLRSNYTARTSLEFVRALSGLRDGWSWFLRDGERPSRAGGVQSAASSNVPSYLRYSTRKEEGGGLVFFEMKVTAY